jgi:hypothetical protein
VWRWMRVRPCNLHELHLNYLENIIKARALMKGLHQYRMTSRMSCNPHNIHQ